MKQQKRTIHTIVLVIAITLLTKVLGVVREALQARVFGTALAFDLYTISYNNTIYIFTTVAYALCVAAVPIISKQLEKDRKAAYKTAGNLICVSLVVSLVLMRECVTTPGCWVCIFSVWNMVSPSPSIRPEQN